MRLIGDSTCWVSRPCSSDESFEAVVWAMILSDYVTDTQDVRVMRFDQLHDADIKNDSN